ncbi:MAG TPA: hypothetical protein DD723_07070 [Candidatus Omnitrophica bacterium]|nr:MAG: hypothetical protein A2Z81_05890 [Omnitrophica WOR_2 bacterium GWA2_45_18]HBR15286.1 hypothetical protein [Candidatus Omnitrophota bacterium]
MRPSKAIFISIMTLFLPLSSINAQGESSAPELTQAFAEAIKTKDTAVIKAISDQIAKNDSAINYMENHDPDLYLLYKSFSLTQRIENLQEGVQVKSVIPEKSVTPKSIESNKRTNRETTKKYPNQDRGSNRKVAIDFPNQDRTSNTILMRNSKNQDRADNRERINARKR